eukprot:TRINITY_DN1471_c0_g1_i8.p1 TRINITY_DN1471_c0_g1~~TRINITY_DN1471_c0_g1_i8.p1  ORF type:complete len:234 (+),score=37.52 TRINITY_DN1471_c0_g1_i8:104-703(+)
MCIRDRQSTWDIQQFERYKMFFGILGPALRAKRGSNFRKSLGVFNYKIDYGHHKKPGVIPFRLKNQYLKSGGQRGRALVKKMEMNSHYPFGHFTKKQKFIYDADRVPFFDVPDLTDFTLKPYVSVHTARISEETTKTMGKINDFRDSANFGRYPREDSVVATKTQKQSSIRCFAMLRFLNIDRSISTHFAQLLSCLLVF